MPNAPQLDDPLGPVIAEPDPLVRYQALTAAQSAYEELLRRIVRERGRAIAQMNKAGLSYGSIATIVGGYTRSRLQQLAEQAKPLSKEGSTPNMNAQNKLIEYLRTFVGDWPRAHQVPFGHPVPRSMADRHTAEQVAEQLLADAAFTAINFGAWLGTPQGQLVRTAVAALAPPLVARDVELLTAALDIAVGIERERRKKDLLKQIGIGAAIVVAAWAATQSG